MAWTAPKTYAVGDVLTAADMNTYQRDNFLAQGQPSWAYAKWTVAMNNDLNYRNFGGTLLASGQVGGYTINNPGSQIYVPETAVYQIGVSLWSPNNSGGYGGIFGVNGAGTFLVGQRAGWTAGADALNPVAALSAVGVVEVAAGEYIQLGGYCNAGATRWDLFLKRLSPG